MKLFKNMFAVMLMMAMTAFVMSACSSDAEDDFLTDGGAETTQMQTVTIGASIASETRTAIGEAVQENGATFRKVVWSKDDAISVKGSDGNSYKFTLTSGEGAEEGSFTGELPAGTTVASASYPYVEGGEATIKAVQTAVAGSYDPTVALMSGALTGDKLEFSHLAAYVKVTTTDAWKQIRISSSNCELDKTNSQVVNAIELNPAEGSESIAVGTYYIVVPSGTMNGFELGFVDANGKDVYFKSSTKTLTLTDGKITNLGSLAKASLSSHEYVDLGLPSGTLWATCNVGATKPEDYGDYYAWGETSTKSTYSWSTYKWCNGNSSTMTKYCIDSWEGTVDNKTTLDIEDDAAHVNWGGDWRMPTFEEQKELVDNCSWKWTTLNGVKGYEVKSKTKGNSLFLPATGHRNGATLYDAGSNGYYWSSLLHSSRSNDAYFRNYGRTVRPVVGGQAQN